MFWSVGWPLLWAGGFCCNLDIFYGGLGIGKLQFLIKKKFNFFFSCFFFFNFWSLKPWIRIGSGYGSVSGSVLASIRIHWIRIRKKWIRIHNPAKFCSLLSMPLVLPWFFWNNCPNGYFPTGIWSFVWRAVFFVDEISGSLIKKSYPYLSPCLTYFKRNLETVEKPVETPISNQLASSLISAPNSWSGGQEFESPAGKNLVRQLKVEGIVVLTKLWNMYLLPAISL